MEARAVHPSNPRVRKTAGFLTGKEKQEEGRADEEGPTEVRKAGTLIGLVGYAQHGKDETGRWLRDRHNFIRVAFAAPLKGIAEAIGWDGTKDVPSDYMDPTTDAWAFTAEPELAKIVFAPGSWNGRKLLVDLGIAIREHLGEDVWVNAAMKHVDRDLKSGFNVVLTDVRFLNEVRAIEARGGECWRVTRPNFNNGLGEENAAEKYIASLPTKRTIVNDGTLQDLGQKVKEAMEEHAQEQTAQ